MLASLTRFNGCFIILTHIFKQVVNMKTSGIIINMMIIIILILVSLTPFFLYNTYSYNFICSSTGTNSKSICNHKYVNVYSYIQKKYWNVGKFFFIIKKY